MNNPSDSFQLDEHLARLLAAYDQGVEGGDAGAPTINVPRINPLPGERAVTPLSTDAPNVGSLQELLPESGRPAAHPHQPGVIGGTHRIGRFELRRQLGKGGCGIVFLAYDPKLEREVALKIPRPEMLLSPDARRRLIREALAAAEFDHPNLVPVYETGEIGPVCFIATAFCPGQTLGEWLDRQAFPVPVRQTARLVAIVAEAVQHAHDRGVLHRDLKPNNVILQATKDDPNEQEPPPGSVQLRGDHYIPRVVDFGLAKLLERGGPSETATRQILGTPKYMAPEQAQARHDDVGPAADVYALGVILYEMLAGRAPYEGATDVEVLRLAIDGNLTPPRHLRTDVPRDLEAICLKAMERVPGKRYRTAIDLADDLRRFLDDKPTLARPLNWPGRAARWLRRNDQAVALAVVTTIATVLLAVGSWSMIQTRQLTNDKNSVQEALAARTRTDQRRDYAKAVRSAFLAWRAGDYRSATEYLEAGRRLAAVGGEPTDFPHDLLTRLVAAEPLMIVCPAGAVTALAVTADGRRLASGHADGTVAVWDRATGNPLASVRAHDGPLSHLMFAAGGTRLFTTSVAEHPGPCRGWTVDSAGHVVPAPGPIQRLGEHVTSLAVSGDGTTVYIGERNGEIRAVYLPDVSLSRSVWPGEPSAVTALCATANQELLAGTEQGVVYRLSATLKIEAESGHTGPITSVISGVGTSYRFVSPLGLSGGSKDERPHPHGSYYWLRGFGTGGYAAGDRTGRVLVSAGARYDLRTGDEGDVRAGTATGDGKTLFTAGDAGIIRAWQFPGDLRTRAVAPGTNVTAAAFLPDGRTFTTTDGQSGTKGFGSPPKTGQSGVFVALRLVHAGTPEARTLGIELRGGGVALWEQGSSTERTRFVLPDRANTTAADLTPDSARLVVGDDRGRIHVWNVPERHLLTSVESGISRSVAAVSLSDDGKVLAASTPESVGVWAVGDAKPVLTVSGDDQMVFKLFPTGDRVATAGRSGVVRIWSVATGREDFTLHGHVGRVSGIGVSPDGRTLVTGGATGEVKFWDLRTGDELIGLRRHTRAVSVIEFSPDGGKLITAGAEVGVWEGRP